MNNNEALEFNVDLPIDALNSLQETALVIREAMLPFIKELADIGSALAPTIEYMNKVAIEFSKSIVDSGIPELLLRINESYAETVKQIARQNLANIELPPIFQNELESVKELFEEKTPKYGNDDIFSSITVRTKNSPTKQATWLELISIVLAVVTIFQTQLLFHKEDVQGDKQHSEIMFELEKQTKTNEELLEIERANFEIEKIKLEKIDELMNLIEHHLSSDQDNPENELESDPALD